MREIRWTWGGMMDLKQAWKQMTTWITSRLGKR
jgi:hypothetical protein